jgi:hypothetical protein
MTVKPDKLANALLKISGRIWNIPPKELEKVFYFTKHIADYW